MQLARHYQTTRQPGRMSGEGMEGQRLVFLYPFAIDNTLGRYSDLCRDFFTVSFINEIKIDNVLNVLSTANQNVGTIGKGSKQINPAELIYKVTQQTAPQQPGAAPAPRAESDPYFYQERINKINKFLQGQLAHDPRFKTFRPVFSTITINELLDIPLIIGSKHYQINNEYLYLLMMVSILYGIEWNSDADIRRANTILKELNKTPGSIAKLMVGEDNRHKFELEANLKQSTNKDLMNSKDYTTQIGTRIQQYLNSSNSMSEILFSLIFNRSKWSANFPEATNSMANMTFNSVHIDTTRTQRRHYEKSINTLSNYLNEYIVPSLHSLEVFAGPGHPSINVPDKITSFVSAIIEDLSDSFVALSTNINQGLISINSESLLTQIQKTSDNIEQMSSLCEDNVNLGQQASQILQKYSDKSRININFDMKDLMAFVKDISTVGNQCSTMGATVDSWLTFLASQDGAQQLTDNLKTIQNKVDDHLKGLLYREYPAGSGHGPWIKLQAYSDEFADMFANFSSVSGLSNTSSDKEIAYHAQYFRQYVADIESALREMIIFFIKWVFFSYSCDYLKDVEVDVEIQKRDALEFPNFALVLPYSLFRDLYITQINRNFKDYITNPTIEITDYRNQDLNFNFNNVKGMFDIVRRQLKIPNLIVIDEKAKKCHYRFMYMTRPITVNFSTMETFVKHQKDVLPGF